MTPARKTTGRVAFVGSGPGDAGLLTVRAQELLAKAEVVVTDPDVPQAVLAMAAEGAEVRPAVGEAAEVAKDLITEAKAGRLVLRLVAGDPLTTPAVVAEVQAVARTSAVFDVVPGVSPGAAVPAYAGVALGGTHTEVDVRGDVDWAALAAAPGPLVLHASSAPPRRGRVGADRATACRRQTPVAVTANGTINTQRTLDTTLETAGRRRGRARRAADRHDRPGRRAPLEAVLVGVAGAVRLEGPGAAHQGAGRRDGRAPARPRRDRRTRCRPSRSSRPAARRRWSARSRAWSTAATSGSSSPPPTRSARCGRSSRSSAWTPARSPA